MQLRRGEVIGLIIPTLRVGMPLVALQRPAPRGRRIVWGVVSTQIVGTMERWKVLSARD